MSISMQDRIKKVFKNFDFGGKPGSLHYWTLEQSKNKLHLTMIDQPYRSTNHRALERTRENYRQHCNGFEVPETKGEHLFASVAAKTGFANQRTKYDHGQFMGHLVVPVYKRSGEEVVGVIDLVTISLEGSYADYFNLIHDLLQRQHLATKIKEVEIKVEYRDNTIKIPLSFASGINCLLEEVRKRSQRLNLQQNFEIKYAESQGKSRSVSTDKDVQDYIAKYSSSKNNKKIRMFIEQVA